MAAIGRPNGASGDLGGLGKALAAAGEGADGAWARRSSETSGDACPRDSAAGQGGHAGSAGACGGGK
jgi:hypothetical protein